MKALGITDGIGSLLYGPKKIGFDIVGNYEWRKYYNTGTFERNFKGSPYITDYDFKEPKWKGIDLITSHPECGNFSNLYTGPNAAIRNADPGDIYKFTKLCNYYRPKVFICDNLPKSLGAVTPKDWVKEFPDHNLDFCWVSNWGYGNVQRNRKRLFVIGVHKDLNWHFIPQEIPHGNMLGDIILGIPENAPNHQKMQLNELTQWAWYQVGKKSSKRMTLGELQPWLKKIRLNTNMPYYNSKKELKSKPGYSIQDLERHSPTLSGGGGFYDNHWIEDPQENYIRPLTMRERLAIQGFGTDFVLLPEEFQYISKDHAFLIKQTGKCMPVQFAQEVARQIARGNKKLVEARVDKIPPIIQEANEYVQSLKR